jgi:FkbM family methyltransferase
MQAEIRAAAHKHLPEAIRKPLGTLAWRFRHSFLGFFEGLYFDHIVRRFRADGCEFEIPRHLTSITYRSCFLNHSYEAEERELIRSFVQPEDSVLECGACLGIVSCVTNKLLRDKTKHVVVEGNPLCIPAIHRNRDINKAGFLVENCALSNQRDVTFYLHPVYIVGGTALRETNRPVRIPGMSLKELDARYGPFTTLIMDVEGAELDSLEPAADLLKQYRLVIVELHAWAIGEEKVERCREILRQAGLRFRKSAGITEAWERN